MKGPREGETQQAAVVKAKVAEEKIATRFDSSAGESVLHGVRFRQLIGAAYCGMARETCFGACGNSRDRAGAIRALGHRQFPTHLRGLVLVCTLSSFITTPNHETVNWWIAQVLWNRHFAIAGKIRAARG
jgi:hypothetical protein